VATKKLYRASWCGWEKEIQVPVVWLASLLPNELTRRGSKVLAKTLFSNFFDLA
jgi:hypothetical protein